MSSSTLIILLSYSILLPCVVVLSKNKNIPRSYLPLALLVITGSLNEIISTLLSYTGHYTITNNNIFALAEGMLISWQFYNWNMLGRTRIVMGIMMTVLAGCWIVEYSLLPNNDYLTLYTIFYSLMIVLLSVSLCSRIIVQGGRLKANGTFIFVIGFILYYTIFIVAQAFWFFGTVLSPAFQSAMFYCLAIINAFCNLIYALAFLWIPTKPKYITSF